MADLTTTDTSHTTRLAYRERREVVMQHEAFFLLAFEVLEPLHVVGRSQSGCDEGLGFAASEDGRAVHARKHAGLNRNCADFVELTAVGPNSVFCYLLAENTFAQH